jgi:para-aminobenzoate N-oxygenase AurF
MQPNHNIRKQAAYNSMFREWDTQSSVRRYTRIVFHDEEDMGKVYFPPKLVPIVQHPLVVKLGPSARREILIQHLYNYLEFTSCFEVEMVNWGVKRIFLRKTGFDLTEEILFDAYKIYCDEGYHSLFCADLRSQIRAVTGIAPNRLDFQSFLLKLEKVQEAAPEYLRPTTRLFIVILFETLISLILQQIPKDEGVISSVRRSVSDHADDEARHHSYFSNVLDIIWPQIAKEQQAMIGPMLPHFIIRSLEPQFETIKQRLAKFDLTRDEIEQIVEESYPRSEVIAGIRKTARVTLSILERNRIYEDPGTLEAFQRSGLL